METRVEARIERIVENYRDEAAVLLMLTQRAEISLQNDPPTTPNRDVIKALALKIQKQQLALLTSLDQIVALLKTYNP
jgi:hypothetical protein